MSTATAEPTPALEQMQPQNWGDPSGKGIIAGMDEFFDKIDNPGKPAAPTPAAEIPAAPVTPAAPVEPAKPAEPAKAAEPALAVAKTDEVELIDEGFFKGEDAPVAEVKEESSDDFDKRTAELVAGMGEKQGAKFKELRAELKAAKQAAPPKEITQELEDLRIKAKEAEGLRERLKETSAASAKLYVENDEDYIREVRQPWGEIHAKLDKLSEVYEMDPSILRALVREEDMKVQDEMIKTHLAGFSEIRRQEVFAAATRIPQLIDKHEAMMKNAEAELGAREAKRVQEGEKLIAEQRKAVQTLQLEKWNRWEKAIPGLLDESGEPTADYTKMKNEALSLDFGKARAGDMAFAALSGVLLPFAQKQIIALQRELAEYRKSDKKALAAAPGSGSSVAQTPVDPKKPATFMEGFMNQDFTG